MKTLNTMWLLFILPVLVLAVMLEAAAAEEAQEPKELTTARTTYQNAVKALVDPVKKKYLSQLEEMKKKLGGKGDIAGATAVQAELDSLNGGTEGAAADGNAFIYATCDDSFTLCINGKEICSQKGDQVVKVEAALKKGATITVKAVDSGGGYGFACVIELKDRNIVSDTKNWKSYTPANKENWFNVKGIQKKNEAKNGIRKGWKSNIAGDSGTDCEVIWGDTPGGTAYLMYEVK